MFSLVISVFRSKDGRTFGDSTIYMQLPWLNELQTRRNFHLMVISLFKVDVPCGTQQHFSFLIPLPFLLIAFSLYLVYGINEMVFSCILLLNN